MSTAMQLRIECCDCKRTATITFPVDSAEVARQLAGQGWRLSPVNHRSDERDERAELHEPLCSHCDEARMRCPP